MAAYYCAPCEAAYDHHQNKPLIDSKMIKVNVSNKDDLNYFLGQT